MSISGEVDAIERGRRAAVVGRIHKRRVVNPARVERGVAVRGELAPSCERRTIVAHTLLYGVAPLLERIMKRDAERSARLRIQCEWKNESALRIDEVTKTRVAIAAGEEVHQGRTKGVGPHAAGKTWDARVQLGGVG